MLDYCDKCGWFWQNSYNQKDRLCEICNNKLKPVPDKYYEDFQGIKYLSDEMKQKLLEKLVFTSPNFDQYYFENAINIKGQRDAEFDAKMACGKAILEEKSRRVTCTYCGSTNVKKIGLLNRAVSTELWGLGSKKIGKQFHCNNCDADF